MWCGSHSLKELFPNLYACSLNQNASFHSILDCHVGAVGQTWNMKFHKGFHDWKLEAASSFLDLRYYNIPRREGVTGMEIEKGVASFLCALIMRLFEVHRQTFSLRRESGVLRHLRGSFSLFGQPPGEWPFSDMCWCSEETVDHSLLLSEVAFDLWSLVFRLFGSHWVLRRSVINWMEILVWETLLDDLKIAPLFFMWQLWKEHNDHIFKDTISSKN